MIKRLSVVIVLVLGIALSLSACGNTDKVVNEPTEAEKVTEAIRKYYRGNGGARNSHRGGGGATCNLCR